MIRKAACFIPFLFFLCLLEPALAEGEYPKGVEAFEKGDFSAAASLFEKVLEVKPGDLEVRIMLARSYMELGRIADAVVQWEAILKIAPGNRLALERLKALRAEIEEVEKKLGIARDLVGEKHLVQAKRILEGLLKGNLTPQQRGKSLLLKARCFGREGIAEGIGSCLEAMQIFPGENTAAEALLIMGILQERGVDYEGKSRGVDPAKTLSTFETLRKEYPRTSWAQEALGYTGLIHFRQKKYEEAVEALRSFNEKPAGSEELQEQALFYWGAALRKSGLEKKGEPKRLDSLREEDQQALEAFRGVIARFPSGILNRMAHEGILEIGREYAKFESNEPASRIFDEFLKAYKDYEGIGAVYREAAQLYARMGSEALEKRVREGAYAFGEKPLPQFIKAIAYFMELAERFPGEREQAFLDAFALAEPFRLGKGLPEKKPDWEAAASLIRLPLERPSCADPGRICLVLAQLFYERGVYEEGILAAAGKEAGPGISSAFNKARELCLTLFQKHPEREAEGRSILEGISSFYRERQDWERAKEVFLPIQKQGEGSLRAYASYWLGRIAMDEGWSLLQRELREYQALPSLKINGPYIEAVKNFQLLAGAGGEYGEKAREAILHAAGAYKNVKGWKVAEGIYRGFIESSKDWEGLDRAAFMLAQCAFLKGQDGLSKEEKESGTVSADFREAMGRLSDFLNRYPKSALAETARKTYFEIALVYAGKERWDAALEVYLSFMKDQKEIAKPEVLRYRAALCHLGKVLKEEVLSLLQEEMEMPSPLQALVPEEEASGEPRPASKDADKAYRGPGWEAYRFRMDRKPSDPTPPPGGAGGGKELASREGLFYLGDSIHRDLSVSLQNITDQQASLVARLEERPSQQEAFQLDEAKAARGREKEQRAFTSGEIVLSEEEIRRQDEALDVAYTGFRDILREYPATPAAQASRRGILRIVKYYGDWRRFLRKAEVLTRFLKDFPKEENRAALALQIARTHHLYAADALAGSKEEMAKEVERRYENARKHYEEFIREYAHEKDLVQEARFDWVSTYHHEASKLASLDFGRFESRYLAAARKYLELVLSIPNHSRSSEIPGNLLSIARELYGTGAPEEALEVCGLITSNFPGSPVAMESAYFRADILAGPLRRYLHAVDAFLEYLASFSVENPVAIQSRIFDLGANLQEEKRWVEATHIFNTFVSSFPQHPKAAEALKRVGDIHKSNKGWNDAISIYRQLIEEYPASPFAQEANLDIADCYINLSSWRKALNLYYDYLAEGRKSHQKDVEQRLSILKDIDRFQQLIDKDAGNRKIDDAQFQIGKILLEKLGNHVKAIMEFEKVVKNYPKSFVADDAQYLTGVCHLVLDEIQAAREAFSRVVEHYPESPLADDAYYQWGLSFQKEAEGLEKVTWKEIWGKAAEEAQKRAFEDVQLEMRKRGKKAVPVFQTLKEKGDFAGLELAQAQEQNLASAFYIVTASNRAIGAEKQVAALSASELAGLRDRINESYRKAVEAYASGAQKYPLGDMTDDALLNMAEIYFSRLKDIKKAIEVYRELLAHYPGSPIAEDAAWRIGDFYGREGEWENAVKAYEKFLYNYPQSPRSEDAQVAIAECFEQLSQWEKARDAFQTYIDKYPKGKWVEKAKNQINWIKVYHL